MEENGQVYFDLEENVSDEDRRRLADADKALVDEEVAVLRGRIAMLRRAREGLIEAGGGSANRSG